MPSPSKQHFILILFHVEGGCEREGFILTKKNRRVINEKIGLHLKCMEVKKLREIM